MVKQALRKMQGRYEKPDLATQKNRRAREQKVAHSTFAQTQRAARGKSDWSTVLTVPA